jgi:hypothetical protein
MFILRVFVRICMYILNVLYKYLHIRTRVVFACIWMYMYVYVCICMYHIHVLFIRFVYVWHCMYCMYRHVLYVYVCIACIYMYFYVYVCTICIGIYCMYMYVLHVYACISKRPVCGYIHNTFIYIQYIHILTYIHIHAYTNRYIWYIHILTYLQIRKLKKCKYLAVILGQYIPISISSFKYVSIRTARFTDGDGDLGRLDANRLGWSWWAWACNLAL